MSLRSWADHYRAQGTSIFGQYSGERYNNNSRLVSQPLRRARLTWSAPRSNQGRVCHPSVATSCHEPFLLHLPNTGSTRCFARAPLPTKSLIAPFCVPAIFGFFFAYGMLITLDLRVRRDTMRDSSHILVVGTLGPRRAVSQAAQGTVPRGIYPQDLTTWPCVGRHTITISCRACVGWTKL